jgi:ribokinase
VQYNQQFKVERMSTQNIVVIGSSNTDMVVKSDHLPAPGETVLGGVFQMIPGGKGANQAVAAARLGGQVSFLAKVGNDSFGTEAKAGFEKHGIDTSLILIDNQTPSGVALIMVDEKGENSISVALGANNELSPKDIIDADPAIKASNFLLIQLEIPIAVVEKALELANQHKTRVILNPAPAQELSEKLLSNVDIITPNESEAKLLTGVEVSDLDSARKAAQILRNKGIPIVIITMGVQGAYVKSEALDELVPGIKVNAVDTTAAGDTFNGALTVALAEQLNLKEAILFANRAAAYSVTKMGAQTSAPTKQEVENLKS